MKTKIILLSVFILWSCTSKTQNLNYEVNQENKNPFLLGQINREGLTSQSYNQWFVPQYKAYQPDQKSLDKISGNLNDYSIVVFMGTWCGDSRRELPRFYKILDACNFPFKQLKVYALSAQSDMYKQSPEQYEKGLNIHRVPTFIFFKNGKEVNRIVESPKISLEKDIEHILNLEYQPNYVAIDKIDLILSKKPLNEIELYTLMEFKNEIKNIYELNTYSRVLMSSGRTDMGLMALKLNSDLFPDKAEVYTNLANAFYKLNNKSEALDYYKKALKIEPINIELQFKIEQITKEISNISNNN